MEENKKSFLDTLGYTKIGKKKIPNALLLIGGVGGTALLISLLKGKDLLAQSTTGSTSPSSGSTSSGSSATIPDTSNPGNLSDARNTIVPGSIINPLSPTLPGGNVSNDSSQQSSLSQIIGSSLDNANAYLNKAAPSYQDSILTNVSGGYSASPIKIGVGLFDPTVQLPTPLSAPNPGQVLFDPSNVGSAIVSANPSTLPVNSQVITYSGSNPVYGLNPDTGYRGSTVTNIADTFDTKVEKLVANGTIFDAGTRYSNGIAKGYTPPQSLLDKYGISASDAASLQNFLNQQYATGNYG